MLQGCSPQCTFLVTFLGTSTVARIVTRLGVRVPGLKLFFPGPPAFFWSQSWSERQNTEVGERALNVPSAFYLGPCQQATTGDLVWGAVTGRWSHLSLLVGGSQGTWHWRSLQWNGELSPSGGNGRQLWAMTGGCQRESFGSVPLPSVHWGPRDCSPWFSMYHTYSGLYHLCMYAFLGLLDKADSIDDLAHKSPLLLFFSWTFWSTVDNPSYGLP